MVRSFARLGGVAALVVAVSSLWITPSAAGGGCHGDTTSDAAPVTGSVVVMDKCAYSPAAIQVDVGDTVTFVNEDVFPHTASGLEWTTDILDQGDKQVITFSDPGTFEYVCKLHPGMAGTVVVGDGESASAAGAVVPGNTDDDSYTFAIGLATLTALLGFAAGRFPLRRARVELSHSEGR